MSSLSRTSPGPHSSRYKLRFEHCVFLLIAIALCLPTVWHFSLQWQRGTFYAHAYLMPLVAGWLLYTRRAQISNALCEPEQPALGPVFVFAAGSFQVLAVVGEVGTLAGIGIPLLLSSLAYAVGGVRLVRPLLLPLLFLALMIPPPGFLISPLEIHLADRLAGGTAALLQRFGIAVGVDNRWILLPGQRLLVAEDSSGLTWIVTMLPLAFAAAALFRCRLRGWLIVSLGVFLLAAVESLGRTIWAVKSVRYESLAITQGELDAGPGLLSYTLGAVVLLFVARLSK